jgi:hypothetical protein
MHAMAVTSVRRAVAIAAGAGFLVPALWLYGEATQTKNSAPKRSAPARQTDDKSVGDTSQQEGPTQQSRSEALASERFEMIRRHVAAAEIRADEAGFPTRFAARPIFKYSDPARGHVAAAVWKLGDEGRPRAILASELDRFNNGKPCISHEYSSLTTTPFSIGLDGMHWTPNGTLYEFKVFPEAPAPEKTPPRRLLQIRELAKRFAGHEVVGNEKCELRLLPQPVDRYVPSKAERADGAIFFLTFGTNPEVMLLIESDGKQWSYAAGRMTGAQEVVLTLDQAIAWEGAPLQKGNNAPFTGSIAPVDIPGISADGREIDE